MYLSFIIHNIIIHVHIIIYKFIIGISNTNHLVLVTFLMVKAVLEGTMTPCR